MKYQDLDAKNRKPEAWITDSIQALISKEVKESQEDQEVSSAEEETAPPR